MIAQWVGFFAALALIGWILFWNENHDARYWQSQMERQQDRADKLSEMLRDAEKPKS